MWRNFHRAGHSFDFDITRIEKIAVVITYEFILVTYLLFINCLLIKATPGFTKHSEFVLRLSEILILNFPFIVGRVTCSFCIRSRKNLDEFRKIVEQM